MQPADFNTYGARRGNHEVLMRGTFANVRLRNHMAGGREGGWTVHYPSGDVLPIFDAATRYQEEGVPLVVFAGKEYGSGSSRDWAAKGPALLGVKVVIAESFERIHRSNLVGMGILPLELQRGVTVESLGLDGSEVIDAAGVGEDVVSGRRRPGGHPAGDGRGPQADLPGPPGFERGRGVLPARGRAAPGAAAEAGRRLTGA